MTTTGGGTTGTIGTVPDGVGDGITGTAPDGDGTLAGDGTVGTAPVGDGDGTTGMVPDGDTVGTETTGMEMVGTGITTPIQEEGEPEDIMETDTPMADITDEHPILPADEHRQEIILVREPGTHQQEVHRFLQEIHPIQEITIITT